LITPWRKFNRFRSLSRSERRTFLRAILALLKARLIFAVNDIEAIVQRFEGRDTPLNVKDRAFVLSVSHAVNAAAGQCPWRTDCVIQAIAAGNMLASSHIPSQLFLGVSEPSTHAFKAHAWLMCGTEIVTGKTDTHFSPILQT